MPIAPGQIAQIALAVRSADRAETLYGATLGLRRLYRFGGLVFFDGGVRLMLEESADAAAIAAASPIYFRCADIALMVRTLEQRGIAFDGPPHRIAEMEDHDLWMAFFRDPDGHVLALMQEAPKGYVPPTA